MKFGTYQVSRKGGREKNEDRMGYCYTRDSGLFALADGMGGHPEGEVASQLALQTLAALFQRDAKPTLKDPLRFLHDAVIAGHDREFATAMVWLAPGVEDDDTTRRRLASALAELNEAAGSAARIERLLILAEPPSLDAGEITDKGYVNQRAVLERRADQVARLYADPPDPEVISPN